MMEIEPKRINIPDNYELGDCWLEYAQDRDDPLNGWCVFVTESTHSKTRLISILEARSGMSSVATGCFEHELNCCWGLAVARLMALSEVEFELLS